MSNFLSTPYSIQSPQSNVDKQLVGQTLSALQGAYDTNQSIIDQTLLMYSTKLKGLRDSDNQYIKSRLKEVTSAIDQYKNKNGNLAYKSTKDSIMTAINSIMDDPLVIDAITSYQNAQNYDAQYQQIIKKDPKLANSANYEYGKYSAGYQDYMLGKTKKLGQMQYTPYTDLTEENLKKLKTIKDIRGKRFVEIQDPNNPGQIVRKEIDGLEDWEINKYLGSTMTSQELGQMRINSWSKFGANNIEANRTNIVAQYDDYRGQKENYLINQRAVNEAIVNNSSMSDSAREDARRKIADLTESISDIKSVDVSKLDTTTIASTLERSNYLNGISQLAKSEWSSEFKKNDVYFSNQNLDIAKQKLDISLQNLGIAQGRLGLEQAKFAQSQGIDPITGQPLTTGVTSVTPMASELAKKYSEEGVGQSTLKSDHDKAYNKIMNDAKSFLQTGADEDINTLKAELNLRGVEVVGNEYRFKNPNANLNVSLANTVYDAFKKSGTVTPDMYKNNEIKKQKASEILTVQKDGYSKVFNSNPDDYVNRLRQEIRTAEIDGQSDLFEGKGEEYLSQAKVAKDFVNRNGGWANIKTNLQRDPSKLTEFADVLNTLTSRFQRTPTINIQRVVDLKSDAKAEIEKAIQTKTESGVMMSAYNQVNITNDKVKENLLKGVVSQDIEGGMGVSNFDPKQNITIRKKGDDVYLEQYKISGTGKNKSSDPLSYKVNKASSLYGELTKYIDLEGTASQDFIQASKDVKIDPMKVSIPSYSTSKTGQQSMMYKVETSIPTSAKQAFSIVNGQPGRLATKELASEEITNKLISFGISPQKVEEYKQKVLSNLNAYQIKTVVKPNPVTNFRNEFAIEVLDNTGKRITDGFLGTDKLSYDMKYSMEMFPQVYVLNQLLYSASINRKNIDEEINKL